VRAANRYRSWLLLWHQLYQLPGSDSHQRGHVPALVAADRVFIYRQTFLLLAVFQFIFADWIAALAYALFAQFMDILVCTLRSAMETQQT